MKLEIWILNVVKVKHLVILREVSKCSLCPYQLLITLIPENTGRNQNMLYRVNVIMRHHKKARSGSGLPFPSPGDLPYPGIEPGSPALQADALPSEPPGKPLIPDSFK